MTKSKKLYRAMLAVVDTDMFTPAVKLDILEVLAAEKNLAEWSEKANEQGGEK